MWVLTAATAHLGALGRVVDLGGKIVVEALFEARTEQFVGVGNAEREQLMSFREVLKYYEEGLRF